MAQQQPGSATFTTAQGLLARARAVGKAVLYLVVAFVGALLVSALLKSATGHSLQELMREGPASGLLAHAALLLALVIVPTAISLLLWREPIADAGWRPARGGRLAVLGLATGAGLMTAIVVILWAADAYSALRPAVTLPQALGMILLSAALWVTQAANEEGLYRGYAFVQLSRAISFWIAALLLSLSFVWGHVGNPGATTLSLVSAGLLALVLAYSFWRTGSLWFALGFHSAWNFTQSFVFGLANSGGNSPKALVTSTLKGPPVLTGGTAGPEGSLLCLLAIAALIAVVHFGLPRDRRPHTASMNGS